MADFRLLEDGTSKRLLEDDTSFRILEVLPSDDDEGSWWAGVGLGQIAQVCLATILAATLAIAVNTQTSVAQEQNEITQPLSPVGGPPGPLAIRVYLDTGDAVFPPPPPTPDEDLWNPPVIPPVIYAGLSQSWLGGNEDVGPLAGQPDEDFATTWLPPPFVQTYAAWWTPQQPIAGDSDLAITPPPPIVEEDPQIQDFWLTPSSGVWQVPIGAVFADDIFVSLPEEQPWIPQGSLSASWTAQAFLDSEDTAFPPPPTIVEDEGWLPTLPSSSSLAPSVASEDESPAGTLFGQPDEDAWLPPVVPSLVIPVRPATDDGDLPIILAAFTPDEDLSLRVLHIPDWPRGFGSGTPPPAPSFVPDEDAWFPLTISRQFVQFLVIDEADAASFTPDEDHPATAWFPPSQIWRAAVRAFLDDELIVPQPAPGQPDEDYLPPSPSWQWRLLQSPSTDDSDLPVAPTVLGLDEATWTPPASAWIISTPRTFADDDVPAGSLSGRFDEDYRIPLPLAIPSPPRATIDDDIWVLFIPPPPIQDEDFWWSWVRPIPATNRIILPYLPDPEEIPAGTLFVGPPLGDVVVATVKFLGPEHTVRFLGNIYTVVTLDPTRTVEKL